MTDVSAEAAVIGKRAVVRCANDVHTHIGRRVLRQGGALRQWCRLAGDKADGERNRHRQIGKLVCHVDSPRLFRSDIRPASSAATSRSRTTLATGIGTPDAAASASARSTSLSANGKAKPGAYWCATILPP